MQAIGLQTTRRTRRDTGTELSRETGPPRTLCKGTDGKMTVPRRQASRWVRCASRPWLTRKCRGSCNCSCRDPHDHHDRGPRLFALHELAWDESVSRRQRGGDSLSASVVRALSRRFRGQAMRNLWRDKSLNDEKLSREAPLRGVKDPKTFSAEVDLRGRA